jgi:DNA-binding response OmpR family regulator
LIAEELVDRGFDVQVTYDGTTGYSAISKVAPGSRIVRSACPWHLVSMYWSGSPQRRRAFEIHFIFLTAMTDRNVELKARQLGADDFVTKPVDFDLLETIINARRASVARNEIWPKLVNMTDREVEVLTWAARGKIKYPPKSWS